MREFIIKIIYSYYDIQGSWVMYSAHPHQNNSQSCSCHWSCKYESKGIDSLIKFGNSQIYSNTCGKCWPKDKLNHSEMNIFSYDSISSFNRVRLNDYIMPQYCILKYADGENIKY